eukprot:gnl/TRDRNA2_/TRDRNA2_166107_c1_seq1.p1 gnl/TRDRNA2_/TRDRNA2_166107_c1~~gnl/TRDRNA2_/TRDRNA2_166107_c1_seq1.p1  ORF type:complete len:796 (-),score=226.64 gnl/TRDRNA2_/TRDRNA2_166107_c1_seq1:45-2192(-)
MGAGAWVEVHGLQSSVGQLLNGRVGQVVGQDINAGRITVDLGGEIKSMKPENLKKASAADVAQAQVKASLKSAKANVWDAKQRAEAFLKQRGYTSSSNKEEPSPATTASTSGATGDGVHRTVPTTAGSTHTRMTREEQAAQRREAAQAAERRLAEARARNAGTMEDWRRYRREQAGAAGAGELARKAAQASQAAQEVSTPPVKSDSMAAATRQPTANNEVGEDEDADLQRALEASLASAAVEKQPEKVEQQPVMEGPCAAAEVPEVPPQQLLAEGEDPELFEMQLMQAMQEEEFMLQRALAESIDAERRLQERERSRSEGRSDIAEGVHSRSSSRSSGSGSGSLEARAEQMRAQQMAERERVHRACAAAAANEDTSIGQHIAPAEAQHTAGGACAAAAANEDTSIGQHIAPAEAQHTAGGACAAAAGSQEPVLGECAAAESQEQASPPTSPVHLESVRPSPSSPSEQPEAPVSPVHDLGLPDAKQDTASTVDGSTSLAAAKEEEQGLPAAADTEPAAACLSVPEVSAGPAAAEVLVSPEALESSETVTSEESAQNAVKDARTEEATNVVGTQSVDAVEVPVTETAVPTDASVDAAEPAATSESTISSAAREEPVGTSVEESKICAGGEPTAEVESSGPTEVAAEVAAASPEKEETTAAAAATEETASSQKDESAAAASEEVEERQACSAAATINEQTTTDVARAEDATKSPSEVA